MANGPQVKVLPGYGSEAIDRCANIGAVYTKHPQMRMNSSSCDFISCQGVALTLPIKLHVSDTLL